MNYSDNNSIFRIEPNEEKILRAERQHKELFEKYSSEERQAAFDSSDGCLSDYKDIDYKKAKLEHYRNELNRRIT